MSGLHFDFDFDFDFDFEFARDGWWIMDWTITRYSYHPSQTVTLDIIEQRYNLLRETRRDIIAERSSLARCPTLQWTRGG